MGLVIDGIVLLIIGACIFNGYKKGLAKSLLKLLTSILAIIIAIVLYKPFQSFVINNTLIDDNIQYSIEKVIKKDGEEKAEVKEDNNMPKPIVKYVNDNLQSTADTAVSEVAKNTARLIVTIICIVAIFIIAKIILGIITILFDIFSKIPVIKQFNELGGLLFGVLEGVFVVLIILTIISVTNPLIGDTMVVSWIEHSFITKMLYNSNIILNIIF